MEWTGLTDNNLVTLMRFFVRYVVFPPHVSVLESGAALFRYQKRLGEYTHGSAVKMPAEAPPNQIASMRLLNFQDVHFFLKFFFQLFMDRV